MYQSHGSMGRLVYLPANLPEESTKSIGRYRSSQWDSS